MKLFVFDEKFLGNISTFTWWYNSTEISSFAKEVNTEMSIVSLTPEWISLWCTSESHEKKAFRSGPRLYQYNIGRFRKLTATLEYRAQNVFVVVFDACVNCLLRFVCSIVSRSIQRGRRRQLKLLNQKSCDTQTKKSNK